MKRVLERPTTYVPPYTPPSGYAFVAAGSLYRSFGGFSLYLKYKGGPANKITVKSGDSNHCWIVCPDREIVIVRNNQFSEAFYPYGESFDEVIDLNLFNDDVSKKFGLDYIMTNYAHSADLGHNRLNARSHPQARINVLSDSGGLQLIRNTTSVIHPADLADFYNNNVDAGMALDIPMPMLNDDALLAKAARLQRGNSDIMMEISKGFEIINIFHGHSTESRKEFRDIVEDPRIPRCAIGDVYNESLLTAMNSIVTTTIEGQRYKQYHVLGTFVASMIPLLVKIGNYGDNPPHITSDSTSHIQSAANKAYHFQFDIFHTSKRIAIGTRESVPNTLRILPCHCPVCKALKYMDILGFGSNRFTTEMLAMHNAFEMSRYSNMMQEACRSMTPKEYMALVSRQLKNNTKLPEVKMAMEFIEIAADSGIKKARLKYKTFLNQKIPKGKVVHKEGLFGAIESTEPAPKETIGDKEIRLAKMMKTMERQVKDWGK
jgi:hypothetical protein